MALFHWRSLDFRTRFVEVNSNMHRTLTWPALLRTIEEGRLS
jgi:hypothetical protein